MQWRFRWTHRLFPGVRAYIGSRSASMRFGVPGLGVDGTTVAVAVALVLAVVIGFALAG
jgi:hypothetical protein